MERLLKDIQRNGYRILWWGIICFAVIFLLAGSYFRWFDLYELPTLDFRFRLRPPISRTDQVVLIEISDDTITRLGHFPIERSYHAMMINALKEAGAKAIVLDMFFSEPQPGDEALAEAIKNAGNVYLPYVLDIDQKGPGKGVLVKGYAAQSLPLFTENAKGTGHINFIPDRDGKIRRVPLYVEGDRASSPYLSFLAGCDILDIPFEALTVHPGESINYGKDFRLPLDEDSMMMINFSGRWADSYRHYSYVDVLRSHIAQFSGEEPLLDLAAFKDKICVIGLTAEGTATLHPNPFESLYPSMGIHAEIMNTLVHRAFIVRASRLTNLIVLIALILWTAWLVWTSKHLKAFLLVSLTVVLGVSMGFLLFAVWGLWVDLFYPTMVVLAVFILNTILQAVLELKKRLILENELKIARQIQLSFLPKTLPQNSRFELAARMLTAREVGGDLYDCFVFDDGRLGVMIGDVTGKGIPASLFMAMAVGAFKFYAVPAVSPEETLRLLNEKLMKEAPAGLFVTMFYAVFDLSQGAVNYANGGHLPVLHVPKERPSRFLDVEDGLPLGMIEGKYTGGRVPLTDGDLFIFYTDGITEAQNASKDMYEKERLKMLVEQHRDRPVNDLLRIIEQDVRQFEPAHRQRDDITYIVLKIV